jgi:phage terminase small subunit
MTAEAKIDGSKPLKSVMQEMFVDNIIKGLPQYEAYQKAGYKGKNEGIFRSNASTLIKTNQNVIKRLAYKRAQLAKKTDITAERVIKEMAKIGFSNIQEFIESGNDIKDISELEPAIAAAVESVQADIRHDNGKSKGYTEKVKIKLHSKLGALNSLAEILKLKDVAGKTDIKILQIGGLEPLNA